MGVLRFWICTVILSDGTVLAINYIIQAALNGQH